MVRRPEVVAVADAYDASDGAGWVEVRRRCPDDPAYLGLVEMAEIVVAVATVVVVAATMRVAVRLCLAALAMRCDW